MTIQRLNYDIDNFARRHGLKKGIEAAVVIKAARMVILDTLPRVLHDQVKVEAYREGILYLKAPSGSALATLNSYRNSIQNKLKKRLNKNLIERIVIRPTQEVYY